MDKWAWRSRESQDWDRNVGVIYIQIVFRAVGLKEIAQEEIGEWGCLRTSWRDSMEEEESAGRIWYRKRLVV